MHDAGLQPRPHATVRMRARVYVSNANTAVRTERPAVICRFRGFRAIAERARHSMRAGHAILIDAVPSRELRRARTHISLPRFRMFVSAVFSSPIKSAGAPK